MGLRLTYEGQEVIVPDGNTAVVGSDPDATIRISKPGISRRHVVIKHDGHAWVVQDASSRNGTYHDGARIQSLDVSGATTIRLGHPSDGAAISLEPTDGSSDRTRVVPAEPATTREATPPVRQAPAPQPRQPAAATPAMRPTAATTELDEVTRALREAVSSIRGLTWSVWAMIAVTAILALLTLFVGIINQ